MCECVAGLPPQKPLRISELNPHLLCALCGGYLIDASTIIECLHSFCRTCIVRYLETNNYCPICEVLIHKTRPWQNIRLDHSLQNAVYKMVPGLFQNEMKRRREFYEKQNMNDKRSRSSGQPQGQLGDRIIFSQDEEFSVSIEFSPDGKPVKEVKPKNMKRPNGNHQHDKRYLKCPAGLRIEHLKKFIQSKFSLPQSVHIDLFYESEPLSDRYSLMDVAYIYLWKRDCVLRLFYSFYELPSKKRKLQAVTNVSERVSKMNKVMDKKDGKSEKSNEDKTKNKKENMKDKKQDRMSRKRKANSNTSGSSCSNVSRPAENIHTDTSISIPNGKRKQLDIISTTDCLLPSRNSASSSDGFESGMHIQHFMSNSEPIESNPHNHSTEHALKEQKPESDVSSAGSHPCIRRHSSRSQVESQIFMKQMTKSSDNRECQHHNEDNASRLTKTVVQNVERVPGGPDRFLQNGNRVSEEDRDFKNVGKLSEMKALNRQNGENLSTVIDTHFQNGNNLSHVKVKKPEILDALSFEKSRHSQNSKTVSKVKGRTVKSREIVSNGRNILLNNNLKVSEVSVWPFGFKETLKNKKTLEGDTQREKHNKKFKNSQTLSCVQDTTLHNCVGVSVMNHRKLQNGEKELSMKNARVPDFGKLSTVKVRNIPNCVRESTIKNTQLPNCGTLSVAKVGTLQNGVKESAMKNAQFRSIGGMLEAKNKQLQKDETVSFGKNVDLGDSGRVSELTINKLQNGEIISDVTDMRLTNMGKISCMKAKKTIGSGRLSQGNVMHILNSEAVSEVQDTKLDNSETVSEVQDTKLDNSEAVSKVQDTKLDNSEAVSKVHDSKFDNSETVSEVQDTKLDNSKTVSKVQDTKLDNSEAVSEVQDTKFDISETVSEVQDTILNNSETISKVQDTKLDNSETVSEVQDTKLDNSETVSKVQETILDNSETVSEVQDTKLDSSDRITKVKDMKILNDETSLQVKDKTLDCRENSLISTTHFPEKMDYCSRSSQIELGDINLAVFSNSSPSQLTNLPIEGTDFKYKGKQCDIMLDINIHTLERADRFNVASSERKMSTHCVNVQPLQSTVVSNITDKQGKHSLPFNDSSCNSNNNMMRNFYLSTSEESLSDKTMVQPGRMETGSVKQSLCDVRTPVPTAKSKMTAHILGTQDILHNVNGGVTDATKNEAVCKDVRNTTTTIHVLSISRQSVRPVVRDAKTSIIDDKHSVPERRPTPVNTKITKVPASCLTSSYTLLKNQNCKADQTEAPCPEITEIARIEKFGVLEESTVSREAKETAANRSSYKTVEQDSGQTKIWNVNVDCDKLKHSHNLLKQPMPPSSKPDTTVPTQQPVSLKPNLIPNAISAIAMTKVMTASSEQATHSPNKPLLILGVDTTTLTSSSPVSLIHLDKSVTATEVPVSLLTSCFGTSTTAANPSSTCVPSCVKVSSPPVACASTRLNSAVSVSRGVTLTLPAKIAMPVSYTTTTTSLNKTTSTMSQFSIVTSSSHNLPVFPMRKKDSNVCTVQPVSPKLPNTAFLPSDSYIAAISTCVASSVCSPDLTASTVSTPSNKHSLIVTSTSSAPIVTVSVVNTFLNIPSTEPSPLKQPQPMNYLGSPEVSSTKHSLPKGVIKLDNFLFDMKSSDNGPLKPCSSPRVTKFSPGVRDVIESHKNMNPDLMSEQCHAPRYKSSKNMQSHITAIHHLPKTISQTCKPYAVARSASVSSSSAAKYNNNIIQTTKISTLIPKSSSINSKTGPFSKSSSYTPSNNIALSRSFLHTSLAPQFSRLGVSAVINGSSGCGREVFPKTSPSLLQTSLVTPISHTKATSSKHNVKNIDSRAIKHSKTKTIPPLSIPKSCLLGATTLKLQRSPGSADHYIFAPLGRYSPSPHQTSERAKPKEGKHNGSRIPISPTASSKEGVLVGGRQRVPTIKISDINRNPIIVDSGSSDTSNNHPSQYRPFSHASSGSATSEKGSSRTHNRTGSGPTLLTGRGGRSPVKDSRRPSDSELLLSRHWHGYSTADLLFGGFKLPTRPKFHDLHYDTDAMPLDYSQSSSKS